MKKTGPKRRPIADRFWEKVDKNGPTQKHCRYLGRCWKWLGSKSKAGQGKMGGSSGRGDSPKIASRVSWEINKGKIPKGLCVLHKCDYPQCTNPAHLFLGTYKDNIHDCWKKGRGHKNGWKKGSQKGELNVGSKLTEKQVGEIRKRLKNGCYGIATILSKEYGVSRPAISQIKSGRNWPHAH